MRRLPFVVLSGLGLLVARTSWAGPPALPTGSAEPAPADAPAADAPATAPIDASAEGSASASADFDVTELGGDTDVQPEAGENAEEAPRRRRRDREGKQDDSEGSNAADDSDPGMVRGRREHMMQTNRAGIGLFHTSLPDAGGKYSFRFRLRTDFFRKEQFMFVGQAGPDQHARVRGGVDIGFSPLEYLELFFSVNNSANRNDRPQASRQDADTVFALGDLDFGAKGAYRLKKYGLGFGGQVGLGLLSGSERLFTQGVNFYVDGLFSVDIRYLTKNQFPFRYTTNIGWMLDNSLQIADFGAIRDSTSREVLRFSLGANHNRMRLRNAIDFPVRFGKERQFGIDPFVEWSWDISTQEELEAFGQPGAGPSPLPRSSQWLTLGVRSNVISGLHVDAGVDVGLVSPNYEFGPPTPPWQVILGLGWSFDPNPVIKEVEVQTEAPTPPPQVVLDGRIVGQVVDAAGAPVPGAIITFPGLTTTSIMADDNGAFTSFRFAEGAVAVQVVGPDATVLAEATAQVSAGEDTSLTIAVEQAAAPATGIMQAAITDPAGGPVAGTMRVVGNGVDQGFDSTPEAVGLIALELNEGDYRATVTAPGFKPAETSFTVRPGAEVNVSVTLQPDAPTETPHVKASKRAIRLTQRIKYTSSNAIASSSKALLDELASFLKQHPEYELVEVRTHTDDKGAAKKRTDERAAAVKDHLVGAGVSGARLSTRGLGSSKPVAVNMTAAGRAKNNRTEFSVKKHSG